MEDHKKNKDELEEEEHDDTKGKHSADPQCTQS